MTRAEGQKMFDEVYKGLKPHASHELANWLADLAVRLKQLEDEVREHK